MAAIETARTRARREVRAAILAAARRHLADDGAEGLSFRAVARDLGMPSSGVYRYFDSRDALLTALIIQSYDSLGEAAEDAVERSAGEPARQRWVAVAAAIRSWAVEHRHEYALLYGTPIPGYAAPTDTVVPGTRVSLALIRIVADAAGDGLLDLAAPDAATTPTLERSTLDGMTALLLQLDLDSDLPEPTLFSVLLAWTQLFGLISFELFGQTRGLIVDHEAFLRDSAGEMAARIGL